MDARLIEQSVRIQTAQLLAESFVQQHKAQIEYEASLPPPLNPEQVFKTDKVSEALHRAQDVRLRLLTPTLNQQLDEIFVNQMRAGYMPTHMELYNAEDERLRMKECEDVNSFRFWMQRRDYKTRLEVMQKAIDKEIAECIPFEEALPNVVFVDETKSRQSSTFADQNPNVNDAQFHKVERQPKVSAKNRRECEICGEVFRNNGYYKYHMKMHRDLGFRCTMCEKAFSNHADLVVHEFTHTSVLTHSCDQCSFTCSLVKEMEMHKQEEHGK